MNKRPKRIIRNVSQHWVGDGFPVRSLFSYSGGNEFDPFLLLDYAGPYVFEAGQAKRGVEEHPHRGFETVTIVFQGELEHGDSSGSRGTIGAGDVQWMTAASGVVHEEFHSSKFVEQGGTLEMIQLWVNLPAADKMAAPKYQDLRDNAFPRVRLANNAGEARVIAGELLGETGPAKTFTPINVWDIRLNANHSVELILPATHNTILVVQSGSIQLGEELLSPVEAALFEQKGDAISLSTKVDSRLMLLSGEPINEPVAGHGPFVMNTAEEIQQAILDYRSGKMGSLV
jgi:quercetin 2,3-dioxygenase